MKRALAWSSVSVLVLVACSGADGTAPEPSVVVAESVPEGTGSTAANSEPAEGFCAAVSALMDAEFEDDEAFGPEARRLLDDVRSTAPTEIADDVTLVVDTLDEVERIESGAVDPDDDETFDRVLELIFSPDFEQASRSIEEYGLSECGFEPDDEDASAVVSESQG